MTIIERNKMPHYKLAFIGLISIWVMSNSAISNFQSGITWRMLVAFVLTLFLLFMVMLTLNGIMELFKPKTALEINADGLVDQVSFSEAGFIAWDKVENVFLERFNRKNHLMIRLQENYTPENNGTIMKKVVQKEINKNFGNVLAINKDFVKDDLFEILRMMDQARGA